MITSLNGIVTRIVSRSGLSSLRFSSRGFTTQHSHAAKKTKARLNSIKRVGESGTIESMSKPPEWTFSKFWKSYLQPKTMPDRWSVAWYREMALICTVFAITGSSTMVLVRGTLREEKICSAMRCIIRILELVLVMIL